MIFTEKCRFYWMSSDLWATILAIDADDDEIHQVIIFLLWIFLLLLLSSILFLFACGYCRCLIVVLLSNLYFIQFDVFFVAFLNLFNWIFVNVLCIKQFHRLIQNTLVEVGQWHILWVILFYVFYGILTEFFGALVFVKFNTMAFFFHFLLLVYWSVALDRVII